MHFHALAGFLPAYLWKLQYNILNESQWTPCGWHAGILATPNVMVPWYATLCAWLWSSPYFSVDLPKLAIKQLLIMIRYYSFVTRPRGHFRLSSGTVFGGTCISRWLENCLMATLIVSWCCMPTYVICRFMSSACNLLVVFSTQMHANTHARKHARTHTHALKWLCSSDVWGWI